MSLLGMELVPSLGGFEVGFKRASARRRRHRAVDGGGAAAAACAGAGAVADHIDGDDGDDYADRSC